MNGLQIVDLKEPKLFERLLNLQVEENAYLEIQNRLASVPILELPSATVRGILDEYDIPLSVAKPRLRNLYRRVLHYFAQDRELSDQELEELYHLQTMFGLSDEEAQHIENAVLLHIYETEVRQALADRCLTEAKRNYLNFLMRRLRIPEQVGSAIYRKYARDLIQDVLDEALEDRRISPEDEAQLVNLSQTLGVTVHLDRATEAALDQCRRLWRIEQGELPEVAVPIKLKPGERCATYVPASYYKSYKASRALTIGDTESLIMLNVMRLVSPGYLYITNKRLIFTGWGRNTSIKFRRIIHFTFRGRDLKVKKEAGRDKMFRLEGDPDLVEAILRTEMAAYEARKASKTIEGGPASPAGRLLLPE